MWECYGRQQPAHGIVAEKLWVARNTNTLLRDLHRNRCNDPLPVADWMEDAIAAERNSARDLVKDLMASLPDDDRRLMQMKLDGYSGHEIGQALGLSRNAVYQRINRIIKKLKQINNE